MSLFFIHKKQDSAFTITAVRLNYSWKFHLLIPLARIISCHIKAEVGSFFVVVVFVTGQKEHLTSASLLGFLFRL